MIPPDNTNPKISVIVPVYKVEKYLPRCVESIINQSFSDFELILVDDGSPDNCGAICDEYSKKDARILVIHQENAKLAAARNSGLDIASGEWVAFVDSDDWLHKGYLNALLSGSRKDTDVVICGSKVTSNETEKEEEGVAVRFQDVSTNQLSLDHIAFTRVWGRIVRRAVIGDLRFVSGTEPAEDSLFNLLLFRDDMKIRVTDTKLYYYFMRPDSAIHTHLGRGTLNSVSFLIKRLEGNYEKEKKRRIITRCYKHIFAARYGEMFSDDYAEVKRQCKTLLRQLSKYLPELKAKDRLIMHVLWKNPVLYRAWRIIDDPTLLQFEKEQKRLKREGREKSKKQMRNSIP